MTDSETRTSSTLLRRVASRGDEQACIEFVGRYGPMVRALGLTDGLPPQECDDFMQEVMIAAVQAVREHRYDREQGRFKVWLKGVVRHKITDAWRAMNHARASGFSGNPNHAAQLRDPHCGPPEEFEAQFEEEWKKVLLEEALEEIRREVDPATYQTFDLYVLQNQPVGEVAKLLGMSRNAVYIAKTRIQDRLQRKLGDLES